MYVSCVTQNGVGGGIDIETKGGRVSFLRGVGNDRYSHV